MIVPDVNVLVYAVFDGYPLHARAAAWLSEIFSGSEDVGLTGPALFGFVRLGTSSRVHEHPLTVAQAGEYVREWLLRPQARFLAPGPRHVELALGLLQGVGTGGNLTTDAQLAAYAIEFGGTIHSNDSDFGRFPGVRWVDPLTRGAPAP
ncbi:MAG: type II toxin-antitoxin system VapC family toxin [Tetrasphaera sp.]